MYLIYQVLTIHMYNFYVYFVSFVLFSRGDNGPRRSNRVGEDDSLKQKKRRGSRKVSRLTKTTSRLIISTSQLGQIQRESSLQ